MTVINVFNNVPTPYTTSGTWSFTVARDDIIRQSMLDIGELGEGDSPTPQEVTDCAFKLNMLVKQWMGTQDFAPGLKMWTRQRGHLFLSSTKYKYHLGPTGDNWAAEPVGQTQVTIAVNQGDLVINVLATSQVSVGDTMVLQLSTGDIGTVTVNYVNSPTQVTIVQGAPASMGVGSYVWNYTTKQQRPLQIVTVILRDIYNNDTPINLMTLQTYEMLPTKTQPGFQSDPGAIYYESQLTNGCLYLDVAGAQDVTKHLHIVFLRAVQDFDNPLDAPEYPQQWYRALCWGLAKDIAPMFNAVWTKEMEDNHTGALSMAREADSETTELYFQPYSSSPYDP